MKIARGILIAIVVGTIILLSIVLLALVAGFVYGIAKSAVSGVRRMASRGRSDEAPRVEPTLQ